MRVWHVTHDTVCHNCHRPGARMLHKNNFSKSWPRSRHSRKFSAFTMMSHAHHNHPHLRSHYNRSVTKDESKELQELSQGKSGVPRSHDDMVDGINTMLVSEVSGWSGPRILSQWSGDCLPPVSSLTAPLPATDRERKWNFSLSPALGSAVHSPHSRFLHNFPLWDPCPDCLSGHLIVPQVTSLVTVCPSLWGLHVRCEVCSVCPGLVTVSHWLLSPVCPLSTVRSLRRARRLLQPPEPGWCRAERCMHNCVTLVTQLLAPSHHCRYTRRNW